MNKVNKSLGLTIFWTANFNADQDDEDLSIAIKMLRPPPSGFIDEASFPSLDIITSEFIILWGKYALGRVRLLTQN